MYQNKYKYFQNKSKHFRINKNIFYIELKYSINKKVCLIKNNFFVVQIIYTSKTQFNIAFKRLISDIKKLYSYNLSEYFENNIYVKQNYMIKIAIINIQLSINIF